MLFIPDDWARLFFPVESGVGFTSFWVVPMDAKHW